jgi:hypothetical protein
MRESSWSTLMGSCEDRAFLGAIVLTLFAVASSVAKAEVLSVEALEFSGVQLLGSNKLQITQGEDNILKIRGDSENLSQQPFVVEGNTLRLGKTPAGNAVSDVKFKLTTTGVSEILLKGSGDIFVKPLAVADLLVAVEGSGTIRMFDVTAQGLEMRVSGSGALEAVNIQAQDARLHLKGSGDIQLGSLEADSIKTHVTGSGDVVVQRGGSADHVAIGMMGSGDVEMKNVSAKTAKVTIMGSGDAQIGVTESLEAEIMGSGDLVYYGKPKASTTVVGSGDITQKDGR